MRLLCDHLSIMYLIYRRFIDVGLFNMSVFTIVCGEMYLGLGNREEHSPNQN